MTDTTDPMISSEDTSLQESHALKKKGRARHLRRTLKLRPEKENPFAAEEKKNDSNQQRTAYDDVKAVLIKVYPNALTMDELNTATGYRWKQAGVLLATNRGTLDREIIRDATYYPARYKINPDVVQIPNEPAPALTETVADSPVHQEAADPPKVIIIHKKKRTIEMPKVNAAQPVEKPARKPRTSGVFRNIVTYLVNSGERLTVDEIREKAEINTSTSVLNTTLSARFAKNEIARDETVKPFRYFISDELKEKYIARYGIEEAEIIPASKPAEQSVLQAAMAVSAAAGSGEVTEVRTEEAPAVSPLSFDATITLDGLLVVSLGRQVVRLNPEQTRKLARMIRFMAE